MPHLPVAAMSMSDVEITRLFVAIVALLGLAHFVGSLFARLHMPRVIGEIAGGLLLGPTLLGHFAPHAYQWTFNAFPEQGKLLAMASEFGLVLLMFMSGMEVKARFAREDRKVAFPLLAGATLLPFLIGLAAPQVFNFRPYLGAQGNTSSITIIIGIAVAITSIPVISKIFLDLGIMHTRFARICLTVATVEDIALWGLLAVAISLSKAGDPSLHDLIKTPLVTIAFFAVAMLALPRLLNGLLRTPAHHVVDNRPVRFALLACFAMVAISELLGVKDMFGALLAGMAICRLPNDVVDVVRTKVKAFALVFFTPIYFAIVGLKLDLVKSFDIKFFLGFFLFCTVVKTLATVVAGRLGTGDWLSTANLAAALNARGGPGIVLASVAFDAKIIDERFFVTLVLTAVVTSLFAGGWFRYVLSKGWPLLRVRGEPHPEDVADDVPLAAVHKLPTRPKEPVH
ncbi:MAG TPA: cation:proton antiporter [Acidimicrobiia bacterium]|nr:cation:proton antiporter [Acidimicrobiia bacterium]